MKNIEIAFVGFMATLVISLLVLTVFAVFAVHDALTKPQCLSLSENGSEKTYCLDLNPNN